MIREASALVQATLGSLFTWGLTAAGAAVVFLFPSHDEKLLDGSLGVAAGVMTAASFWSLLSPALEMAEQTYGHFSFVPVAIGFAAGAAFVHFADKLLNVCNISSFAELSPLPTYGCVQNRSTASYDEPKSKTVSANDVKSKTRCDALDNSVLKRRVVGKGPNESKETVAVISDENDDSSSLYNLYSDTSWKRVLLLIVAVTVHNIPEGMAVGVGFGAIGKSRSATFESARNLAYGIGIQNFPEGLAVSLPLAGLGYSKFRSFMYGQLSGMVEPVAAILGAICVQLMEPLLPYALSFAAGAMIFVVVDDIVPEAQLHGNGKLASWSAILGFIIMMALDVGLSE